MDTEYIQVDSEASEQRMRRCPLGINGLILFKKNVIQRSPSAKIFKDI